MKYKAAFLILLIVVVVGIVVGKNLSQAPGENTTEPMTQNSSGQGAAGLIEQAKQNQQPAWLLFHSTSCQSCIEMEQVFQTLEPEFKGKVAFINIDVNDSAEQSLCIQYGIQYIPTTYFLNASGAATFNYVGVIQEAEMRAKLKALGESK